jgi:hypothetical protein
LLEEDAELNELKQKMHIPMKKARALCDNHASQSCFDPFLDSITDSIPTCGTANLTILPSLQKSDSESQQKTPAGVNIKTTETQPSSEDKRRLIVWPVRFPDPKNCAFFSQLITRGDALCWFHKNSGRAVSITMTQHEALERGPSRPRRFQPGASLPTTQFFALTLGATSSAEHYHAFRRPPPARGDKNQARRVPQKQAMQNNDYFKISFKLTRGATLRKEHYRAFRKPPPTCDRKQDWIGKYHEQ